MSGDYLWDGSGEPDPEIQRLEAALRPLRGTRPAPQLGPRAPAALLLGGGPPWPRPRPCCWPWPRRPRASRPPPRRSRPGLGARLARGRSWPRHASYGSPGSASASGSTPARARAALGRQDRRGAAGAGHAGRAAGRGRALASPLARARRHARRRSGRRRASSSWTHRRPWPWTSAAATRSRWGGRLRPPARRGGLGGLREPRAAVARPRRRRLPHAARRRAGHAVLRDRARGAAPGPRRDRLRLRRGPGGAPPSSAGSPRRASATRSRCGTSCPASKARIAAGSSIASRRSCRRRRGHARGHPPRRPRGAGPVVGRAGPRLGGLLAGLDGTVARPERRRLPWAALGPVLEVPRHRGRMRCEARSAWRLRRTRNLVSHGSQARARNSADHPSAGSRMTRRPSRRTRTSRFACERATCTASRCEAAGSQCDPAALCPAAGQD